jgi:NAD(P)-dependent dehydrogenase (short-subunit alcohol dehydrogenase family)
MKVSLNDLFSIAESAVIVTGAAGGIGSALVDGFAALGAKVLAVDIAEPRVLPAGAYFQRADLRESGAAEAIVRAALSRFGTVDILINNAGIFRAHHAENMPLDEWSDTMAVNLTGAFTLSQAVGKEMIARRSGKIVNIASRGAYIGMPFGVAYNASKAGMLALTRTLAVEWGVYGIQVNAIVPGVVKTAMADHRSEAEKKMFARTIPAGRESTPSDLLGAAVFLSSAASNYVTGASLFADGGNYMACGIGTEYRDLVLGRPSGLRLTDDTELND